MLVGIFLHNEREHACLLPKRYLRPLECFLWWESAICLVLHHINVLEVPEDLHENLKMVLWYMDNIFNQIIRTSDLKITDATDFASAVFNDYLRIEYLVRCHEPKHVTKYQRENALNLDRSVLDEFNWAQYEHELGGVWSGARLKYDLKLDLWTLATAKKVLACMTSFYDPPLANDDDYGYTFAEHMIDDADEASNGTNTESDEIGEGEGRSKHESGKAAANQGEAAAGGALVVDKSKLATWRNPNFDHYLMAEFLVGHHKPSVLRSVRLEIPTNIERIDIAKLDWDEWLPRIDERLEGRAYEYDIDQVPDEDMDTLWDLIKEYYSREIDLPWILTWLDLAMHDERMDKETKEGEDDKDEDVEKGKGIEDGEDSEDSEDGEDGEGIEDGKGIEEGEGAEEGENGEGVKEGVEERLKTVTNEIQNLSGWAVESQDVGSVSEDVDVSVRQTNSSQVDEIDESDELNEPKLNHIEDAMDVDVNTSEEGPRSSSTFFLAVVYYSYV
ncbi:hypothetical protein JVU11DRAFT_1075 [Chiua virens]|nr:hypothetical protein JVU11DRAFT_1075 [Chiua virens]